MYKLKLFLHTLRHLRISQLLYQVWRLIYRVKYREYVYDRELLPVFLQPCIHRDRLIDGEIMCFLNISDRFRTWSDISHGMLWAYNVNYMDWLVQDGATVDMGMYWIDKFIKELPENRVGLDPYPTALRGINWMKFIVAHRDRIPKRQLSAWNTSLYSQYKMLFANLEYHIQGNHLLEDIIALYIASIYFNDPFFYRKTCRLLIRELDEQILPDGAHYEQSPMYHCIILGRLLDCYNFSVNNYRFDSQCNINELLCKKLQLMLGHLNNICYSDGSIPLLNDSAYHIAPSSEQLNSYAYRLGIKRIETELKECGYRRMRKGPFDAIVDVGNITATYQPGHSHADTFNYELRVDGKPFIIDVGISTYDELQRRYFERSTQAHNTVAVGGADSSEVWGKFRVGNRANVTIVTDQACCIKALHDGYGKHMLHSREFLITDQEFTVCDSISNATPASSYIHFAPDVSILSLDNNKIVTACGTIYILNAVHVSVERGMASCRYNDLSPIWVVKIDFNSKLSYSIRI